MPRALVLIVLGWRTLTRTTMMVVWCSVGGDARLPEDADGDWALEEGTDVPTPLRWWLLHRTRFPWAHP